MAQAQDSVYKESSGVLSEIEARLAGILDDFMGGTVETFSDEGVVGEGVVVRIIIAGRMVEINATIIDVTEDIS